MLTPPFAITEHPAEPGVARLRVHGELDLEAASNLEGAVAVARRAPGVRAVILDLTSLTFLDAAGVAGVVRAALAATAAGVQLRTENATGIVCRVLDITGVGEWLHSR
ncbi:anti-sigma factor antagonist [Actinoplanes sp. NPDC051859]|uniref:anti-sigma factor antagonist n=1 Tax=Actinoplanes sp. NPDC051859 TaxID=3363909 RepID=UPI00379C32DA